jgi:hypothetical protein
MAVPYKICIDCSDPHRLAAFWAVAMGYVVEDHSALIARLREAGVVSDSDYVIIDGRPAWPNAAAIRDPEGPVDDAGVGLGGRVLFQKVPEPKIVKNRVHLDLHVGADRRAQVVATLTDLGAHALGEYHENGASWIVMADPEGNEFCVS